MRPINLCIIKPNKDAFSETFIQAHVSRLHGSKKVLYGGSFPVYDHEGNFLIKSKLGLLSYFIQKRIFKKEEISVRTNALVAYLEANRIDVVLAEYGMVGASVYTACKLASVPLVIHFHGADAHHKPTVESYRDRYKKAFDYAAAIIGVSGDMIDALIKLGAPAHKLILNPYGVDTVKFPQINIAGSSLNFLSVGRFVEKKSPSSVINAFKLLAQQYPDAHLWMVGNGPLYDDAQALIQSLNLTKQVTLTGVISATEIQKLMQEMRCFVQHSVTAADGDMEGTPNTILEAGASGLAIVSTLHAGIKEAVINNETGFLVAEHDVDGMAAHMKTIAGDVDIAVSLGAKEAAHIRENYEMSKRIKVLDDILQKVTDKQIL